MTSTFTTNKTLELPANGDYVNTWNIPVNSDMTVIDTALGGTTSLNATAGSATLTYTQYRPLILSVSGAVSANVTYTIPSGVGGQWIVRNAMTDSSGGPWDLIFASGGGGTSVIVSRGYTTTIYSDGTNISYSDSRLSTAAGSNRQIQYNNNGVLGASSTFVYDTSGNVGIGGTPSAWANGSYALQVGTGASVFSNNVAYSYFGTNNYFDGTNWRYMGTGRAVQYLHSNGSNIWNYSASGTAGGAISWQEAMRIDTSGNVGIGTSSPTSKFGVTSAINDGISVTDGTVRTVLYSSTGSLATIGTTTNHPLQFFTNNSSKMYIDTSGNVGIGTASPVSYGKLAVAGDITSVPDTSAVIKSGRFSSAYGGSAYSTSGGSTFMSLQIEGSEKVRIDSSGNVGIGASTVSIKLTVSGNAIVYGATPYYALGATYNDTTAYLQYNAGGKQLNIQCADGSTGGFITFGTGNGNERMRIDATGSVYVGAAGGGSGVFNSLAGSTAAGFFQNNGTTEIINISNSSNTAFTAMRFIVNAFTTVVGSISCSTSATAFNTSSDYRLKNSVTPMTSGLSTVLILKPVNYKWNVDNSDGEGFIAHELAEIIPLAVTGEKDAVDKDGKIQPQGVDYSKVVVHLVAAIQELAAKVAALEGK